MARQISVELVGDTRDFEQSMDKAGASVERLESDLKSADAAAGRFDGALDKTTDKLGGATNGFRSTADLAGGLGDVLGISALGPMAQYATGMADIADGMGGLLAPALTKAKGAFLAMNVTLLANPIFLVVASLAALAIGFTIAYKKVGWFRDGVDAAFSWIKNAGKATLDFLTNAVVGAAKVLGRVADIITTPYQIAFRAIAKLWNSTVGALEVNIPGFLGFGGVHFGVPDIPMLANGGPLRAGQAAIVGERGPELFVPRVGGTVVPGGAGGVTVVIATGASDLDELIRKRVRVIGGGSVQRAYGTT